MPNYKGNKVGINGPIWKSHPDEGCELSRGRKCRDCLYSECLYENDTNRGFSRRWIELPLGEGEFLYCKDCGRQLYGTTSPLKDAPREKAWLWIQVWDKLQRKDVVLIVVCSNCRKLDASPSEDV